MPARKTAKTQRQTEDRFRALFEQSIDAMYVGTPDGAVKEANQAWLDLFGYTRDEIPHINAIDLYVNPAERADFLRRIAETGFVKDEVLYKRKDGAPFLCQRSLIAQRDEAGAIVTFHGINRDISRIRKAETLLRASEARYRSLFESSMDAIYMGTPEGRVIDVNHAWLELFGYTREELPGLHASDFYADPQDRGSFARQMAENGFVQDEVWYRRKDGTVFLCQRNQVALKDESGAVVAFQGVNRDVSQIRQAEAALRDSEQRFRALFEQSMDAIYISTPDGASLEANQAWLDLFGYSREDMATLNAIELYADSIDRESFVRRMLETGFVRDEVRYRRKSGEAFDAERTVAALKDNSGRVTVYQGVIRDITERKRAEQALRESERRNRSIVQVLPDIIIRLNREGAFLDVIASASHKLAIPSDQIAGKTIADILPADDATRAMSALQETLTTGFSQAVEYQMEIDSTRFWFEARFSPSGETEAIALVRDITERKSAEQALAESERKYRELFQHSMDAISLVSPGGLVLEANQAYLNLFGYREEDIGIANIEEHYVNPDDRTRLLEAMARDGELVDDEVRLRKSDGTVMDCVRTVVLRCDARGNMIGDQSVIRDITARKQAEEALRESEERFRSLFEQSTDAIYLGTPAGVIIDANPALLDLFGYTRDELQHLTASELYADPVDRHKFLRRMETFGYVRDEVRFRKKDGTVFDCERNVVARKDVTGCVVAYQGVLRDITQQKRDRAELERLARFDALTGVLNRRSILDKMADWITHVRRYKGHLSVVMLDIDHFKLVNDSHGHQVGDRVLADVAALVQRGMRTTDFVGRYGGEEFLVVLPRSDAAGAAIMAERTRAMVQETTMHDADSGTFGVTASFGVAEWCEGDNEDAVIRRADAALYRAKQAGRNRVEVEPCTTHSPPEK